jgi:hypothetical protein
LPKPIDPAERNARSLINILARYSNGMTCEDLNREFQRVTKLQRQSYYNALKLCRKQGWVVGGGGQDEFYILDPSGSWKPPPPSAGEVLEQHRRERAQLEYLLSSQVERTEQLQSEVDALRDLASGTNGIALENLIKIVTDTTASPRQRLKAASVILGYRVQNSEVTELAKRYLETLCASAENVDYRIEASEVLRRCEDPRIAPSVQRPVVAVVYDTPQEIAERGGRRRKHIELQAIKNAQEMEAERQQMAAKASVVRN